jgi:isoleucyl-tRNA synthetase
MGYRTQHEYWKKWFPGDFISESFPGQFRNWFYALLTMAAVLEGKPATRTIHGYETLLAEDGSDMHKSRGNMIEFNEAADKIGADVMRWMYCCQRYESDMLFGYHVADETRRRFFLPLWNVYNFFVTYANLDKWMPDEGRKTKDERSDLDCWILARLQQVVEEVTTQMDEYMAYKATKPIEEFIDDLSNWYVRRSRRRFWKSEADADKNAAYATLYQVLVTLTKVLAPFIPFATEVMYQNLVRSVDASAPESVHHCDFPRPDPSKVDAALLAEMDAARKVVNLGHSVRSENSLKVRQPLGRVVVVAPQEQRARLAHMSALVTDELNVKTMQLVEKEAELVTYKLLPDNRLLGPRFGKAFPQLRAALNAADPYAAVTTLRAGKNLSLEVNGERVELAPDEVLITPQPKPGFAVKADGDYVVALETNVTAELKAEGLAREFVRRVQDLRKSAAFDIADHIRVYYSATPTLANAIEAHRAYIMGETLAEEMRASAAPANTATVEDAFDGEKVTVGVRKCDA